MIDNNEYIELLYAYSFGCLDAEDLTKLKSYLDSEGSFPWQELGEYQNLSSLLPSILAIETPAPEVKDTVARKLYRIRDEIKAKRAKLNKNKNTPQVIPDVVEEKREASEEQKTPKESVAEDFEPVVPIRRTAEMFSTPVEDPAKEFSGEEEKEPHKTAENEIDTLSDIEVDLTESIEKPKEKLSYLEKKYSKEVDKNKKESGNSKFLIILFMLIVIIGVVIVYLKISSNIAENETKINSLNNQITNLSDEASQNRQLQLILTSKDLKTLNLEAVKAPPNTYGKLFVSPDNSKGVIQVSNIQELSYDNVYQLWIEINRQYYSLAIFKSAGDLSYIAFDLPSITDLRKVGFILTKEPKGGSEVPTGNVVLKGTF